MIIKDDGQGFDKAALKTGNGLPNMQHRAGLMNAALRIESAPGRGTTILLQLKIN